MDGQFKAALVEQGSKLFGDFIRLAMSRPVARMPPAEEIAAPAATIAPAKPCGCNKQPEQVAAYHLVAKMPEETTNKSVARQDLDYRFECCMKHLGAASVLLKEAYERANDEGIGDGTAEKIMEAMNEHAGMEADLEKMLDIPEAKPIADKLLSGARAFRAASWKANLPRGSGTKEDVSDARIWNDLLFQEAYAAAKKNPGQTCIAEGM